MLQSSRSVMGNYGTRGLCMQRGEGVYLYDVQGRRYLDFTAGIAVCVLGHAHPQITATLVEQAGTLIHCSNLYENTQQNRLATRLAELSGLDKAFFCNSGTEANEAAIKLARRYAYLKGQQNRTKIVSLPRAFHGRTLGSLSITPKAAYQEGYQPLLPGCDWASTLTETLEHIDKDTAACFVEVVQGEGGVHSLEVDFLRAIENRCHEAGALLVVDEVQTGVGRTGSFFAFERVGLHPDVVTMAKGLANGVPVGAVLARQEVADAFTPGSHGSTFGGNPLAMAVANTVVDIVAQPTFLEHVREVGDYLSTKLQSLGDEVSGIGLMQGMTVPDAKSFVAKAAEHGVLLTAVGNTRVRFVPPLIVQSQHVDELAQILAQ
ncbi:acetylornithine/succinylornithine family transaminase [Alicyclobacillaceae bacterium I2511]|nr:acetylornithine/succinylornithine family transaminase [Alicyclobacillaceae bacterium I2511]